MNRLKTLSFVVLLGLTKLGAQTATGLATVTGLDTGSIVQAHVDPDCPVSMRALHEDSGGIRFTQNARSPVLPTGFAQRIRLSVGSRQTSAEVTGARVTVHGTGTKTRAVPARLIPEGLSDSQSSEIKRTLDINFHSYATASVEDNGGRFTDMVLSGFTSVHSITLDSLSYADGSVWTPQAGRACRIVPELLMLVDGR